MELTEKMYVLLLLLLGLGCSSKVTVDTVGDGSGSVQSSAGGSCSGSCELPPGRLSATPDPHSIFAGWGGDCSGTGICDADRGSYTARFVATDFPFRIVRLGQGAIVANGDVTDGTYWAHRDSSVSFHAQPAESWLVQRWGGACAGTSIDSECRLLAERPQEVLVEFEPAVLLTVNVTGPGRVLLEGIGDCAGSCTFPLRKGQHVHLASEDGPLGMFAGWEQGCSGNSACDLTIESSLKIGARFVPAVEINNDGDGRVSVELPGGTTVKAPCKIPFDGPMTLRLGAFPDSRILEVAGCAGWASPNCSIEGPSTISVLSELVFLKVEQFAGDISLQSVTAGGGFEYLWLQRLGDVSFRGRTFPDPNPQPSGTRHTTLLRLSEPNVVEEVVSVPAQALVQAATSTNGRHTFGLEFRESFELGTTTLAPQGEDVVIAQVELDKTLRWQVSIAGDGDEELFGLVNDADTGDSIALFSSTSSTPRVAGVPFPGGSSGPYGSVRLYLLRLSESGLVKWVVQGPVGRGLLGLDELGVVVLGQFYDAAGSICLPPVLSPPSIYTPFAFRVDATGACTGASVGSIVPPAGQALVGAWLWPIATSGTSARLAFHSSLFGDLEWGATTSGQYDHAISVLDTRLSPVGWRTDSDWCGTNHSWAELLGWSTDEFLIAGYSGCVSDGAPSVPAGLSGPIVARISTHDLRMISAVGGYSTLLGQARFERLVRLDPKSVAAYGSALVDTLFGEESIIVGNSAPVVFRLELRP